MLVNQKIYEHLFVVLKYYASMRVLYLGLGLY